MNPYKKNIFNMINLLIFTTIILSCSSPSIIEPFQDTVNDKKVEVLSSTYFVDAKNGNDLNLGTSPDKAWKSLEHIINRHSDRVLSCFSKQVIAGMEVLYQKDQVQRARFLKLVNMVMAPDLLFTETEPMQLFT